MQHECLQNWNESSQSMETANILEGFLDCEEKHGVRFMNLIGDGDSLVYTNIVKMFQFGAPTSKKSNVQIMQPSALDQI